jgi:hypothetical protein
VHFLPPGNLYQIITHGTVLGTGGVQRKVVNSWSYLDNLLGPPGHTAIGPIYTAFINTVWNPLSGQINGGPNGYQAGILTSVTYEGGTLWSNNGPGFLNPSGPGGREPVSTAVCCTMRCAARGRIYTGRKMLGPVGTFQVTGEELMPVAQAAWQGACNNFLTPLAVVFMGIPLTLTPVIWSQLYSNFVPAGNLIVGDFLTAVHVNRTLSSWRHRRERTVR